MRATRAYLAGFGTSGSLLAGAAAMFLLASAIVAFRGWPQVGDGTPAPVAVAAAQSTAPGGTRTGRLLTAAAARLNAAAAAQAAARTAAGRAGAGASAIRVSASTRHSSPSISTQLSTIRTLSGCGTACPVQTVSVTSAVAQVVSSSGQDVGAAASGVAGSVAGSLSGTSPSAANTVSGAGSAAGGTVTGTSTTAAGVVTSTGTALGGGSPPPPGH